MIIVLHLLSNKWTILLWCYLIPNDSYIRSRKLWNRQRSDEGKLEIADEERASHFMSWLITTKVKNLFPNWIEHLTRHYWSNNRHSNCFLNKSKFSSKCFTRQNTVFCVCLYHLNGTVLGRSAPSLTRGLWNSRPALECMIAQHCSQ